MCCFCSLLTDKQIFRADGGIGIRVRLRGACLTAWGFESLSAHTYKIGLTSPIFLCICREQANCFACVGTRKAQRCFCLSVQCRERQKPRARPAGKFRQEFYRKASPSLRIVFLIKKPHFVVACLVRYFRLRRVFPVSFLNARLEVGLFSLKNFSASLHTTKNRADKPYFFMYNI